MYFFLALGIVMGDYDITMIEGVGMAIVHQHDKRSGITYAYESISHWDSEQSLDGKLFVQFVALIYISCIKQAMQKNNLFGTYTLQGLLDQLDVIECFGRPGKDLRVGEITKKQQELYTTLGVDPPSSL